MAKTVFATGSALRRLTVETEADAEALVALKADATYRVEIVQPKDKRSIQQHRLLFGLLKLIRDNTAVEPPLTDEVILNVLKLRTGHVKVAQLPSGEVVMTPASIAFANMPQSDFNPWFEKALAVMCRDFLPGLSVERARREIEAVAFGHGQRRAA
jgi:hypothetical protein